MFFFEKKNQKTFIRWLVRAFRSEESPPCWRNSKKLVYLIFHGIGWNETMKAKVMPDGRLSLPADLRRRHGLSQGGEVIVEDVGDAIVLRTLDQVVARAQAMSRILVAGRSGASVDDFLADRTCEAAKK